MDAPAEVLGRLVQAFREANGRGYLQELAGGERLPLPKFNDHLLERVADGRGELAGDEYAALCAHLARAELERHFRAGRSARRTLGQAPVKLDSQERPLESIVSEWLGNRDTRARKRLVVAVEPVLAEHNQDQHAELANAEWHARTLLDRLAPARHPDAGPEDGSRALATQWLSDTAPLAAEAFAAARALHACDADDGDDTLWAVLAPRYTAIFPRENRFRRIGAELAPLGLQEGLRRSARLTYEQPDVLLGTQVVALAVPGDVRLSGSSFSIGLASEWRAAEAVGRCAALALSARGAFAGLRHPTAGTSARALGAVTALRFSDPEFLRRQRGLSRRESEDTARCAVAHALAETRILAASVLARGKGEAEVHALMERALLGAVGPALSGFLATRVSGSASLRAKAWAPALGFALRERFDADWTRNPRAADALCGAATRAGALSVETWAEELSASIPRGIALYSELF